MPTYQYACTECGHAFEQFQSFSDDALSECPQCTGRLRKLFNAVGVVFKGSGFYRTDSRSGSSSEGSTSATEKKADSPSGSGSGSGSSGSTGSGAKESSSSSGSSSSTAAASPASA